MNKQYGYVLNWDAVDREAPVRDIPAQHRQDYLSAYGLPKDYGRFGENFRGHIALGGHGVYAVGAMPEDAITAFAVARGWGEPDEISPLDGGDGKEYTWGRRFTAGGTNFKAAGRDVPGGVILTWWE